MIRRKKESISNILISSLLLTFVIVGCANNQASDVFHNTKNWFKIHNNGFTHVVKYEGETLAMISKWYTGNAANHKSLANINSKLNPKRLQKGHKILIPPEMLKTKSPMPQRFVSLYDKQKAVASNGGDQTDLFGPKE